MRPTLAQGEVLLVGGVGEGEALRRGEVVVVRGTVGQAGEYLKRIVGLPGEEVRIVDGLLFVDGTHTRESYLGGLPSSVGLGETAWTLGASEYLVLGDNRAHSTDSRHFGPVSHSAIAARVWLRCWPPSRLGRITSVKPGFTGARLLL